MFRVPRDSIEQLRETGMTNFPITAEPDLALVGRMAKEAGRIPPVYPLKRHIKDPTWIGVRRSTFHRGRNNSLPRRLILPATLWAPGALYAAAAIDQTLQEVGEELATPELATSINRIGINYMGGTVEQPAVIGVHRDVEEEKGVVVVVSVDDAQMSLIACHNVCKGVWEIDQPLHSHATDQTRLSFTFAQFDAA